MANDEQKQTATQTDDTAPERKALKERMEAGHSGTSPFTHVDDANADIHPATEEGARRLFYGKPMTPKHELTEVVLGPAPFGSPDPRTLGHQMVPLVEGPASARELDPEFQALQDKHFRGTGGDVEEMTKDELLEEAERQGVDVSKSDTKDEIKEKLNEDSDDSDSFSGKSKAELLEEAKNRGLQVDESNSKAEIREALENSNK